MVIFCLCLLVISVNMIFGLFGFIDFLRRDVDGEFDDLVDFFICCGVEGGFILVFFIGVLFFVYIMISKLLK